MKDGRSATLEEFDNDPVAALIDANNTKLTGMCFALVMEHEGQRTIHYRSQQPCYGECRKYLRSHPKTYSDPLPHDDYRPGDLFDPFPEGKPVAVSFGWRGRNMKSSEIKPSLDLLFSASSPWRSGFGSPEDVEFTTDGEIATGVIFKNTYVDPTVMINLMQNCKKLHPGSKDTKIFDDFGDHPFVLLLSFTGFNVGPTYGAPHHIVNAAWMQGYYNPMTLDIPRFLNQRPHDLSGGTFHNGADYNRKILHEVFERSRTVFDNDEWTKSHRKDVPNLSVLYRQRVPDAKYDRSALLDTIEAEFERQIDEDKENEAS